jgi:hypothetical protein
MRRALAATAVLLAAGAAFAKAPAAVPTVEEIAARARTAAVEAARRAEEAAKDPLKEAIDSYREGKTPLADWQKLADVVNDAKDADAQRYRMSAAEALVVRFEGKKDLDAAERAVRREIGLALVDLMKSPASDDTGLKAIERVLYAFWPDKLLRDVRFKASDKLRDRTNAHSKMKKYLKSDKD